MASDKKNKSLKNETVTENLMEGENNVASQGNKVM